MRNNIFRRILGNRALYTREELEQQPEEPEAAPATPHPAAGMRFADFEQGLCWIVDSDGDVLRAELREDGTISEARFAVPYENVPQQLQEQVAARLAEPVDEDSDADLPEPVRFRYHVAAHEPLPPATTPWTVLPNNPDARNEQFIRAAEAITAQVRDNVLTQWSREVYQNMPAAPAPMQGKGPIKARALV